VTWTEDSLNAPQRRHVRECLAQLERQLAAIEALGEPARTEARFPRYADDLTDADRSALAARLARARAGLATAVEACGIRPEPASLGARQAVAAQWSVAELGLDDLLPAAMRAYGPLEAAAARLEAIASALRAALAPQAEAAPAAPGAGLEAALQAALPEALEAMAGALADAALARAANDELPLVAADALTRVAHRVARTQGAPAPLPALDIRAIRWRLDAPPFTRLGRDWVAQRFARQLAPLRDELAAALRSFAARCR
jgi:hypothetical protein